MSLLFLVLLLMSTDVVYEHLHVAYVGQWFLVAFVAVSFLGQLVVVALSVPDSLHNREEARTARRRITR